MWEKYYGDAGQSGRQDSVWMEDDPDLADDWGHMMTKKVKTKANPYPYHVYEVEPEEDPVPQGSATDLKSREGWSAPAAVIKRKVPREELLRRY